MNIFHSIVLGIVQGIGEFLPISSSAHLIIVPYLFNWAKSPDSFDIALHFGTLIAVLSIYFNDWLIYAKGAYQKIIHKKESFENKMFWYLVVATIPGAIAGLLLEDIITGVIRNSMLVIAIALGVMGILIYLGDKYAEKKYKDKECTFEKISLKDSIIIGISQAFALIPGFSRSGTTILTGRILGLSREAAAKFTFLLSVPVIVGATIFKIKDLVNAFSISFFVGVIASAVVGILSIKFLLKYLKNNNFAVFAYYRVIISIILIVKIISVG